MCGICGETDVRSRRSRPPERADRHARSAIVHRGPDGAGLFVSPDCRVGLGFRRLRDHRSERRWPTSRWRTKTARSRSSFNGEIYNFQAIRARAGGARPPVPLALRHRSHRAPLRGRRGDAIRRSSTGCSRSRSGTAAGAGSCWRAIAPARSRSSSTATRGGWRSPRRSRRSSRIPTFRSTIDPGAHAGVFRATATCRIARDLLRGVEQLPPATGRAPSTTRRRRPRRALLAAAVPATGDRRRRSIAARPRRERPTLVTARGGAASRQRRAARRVPQRRHRLDDRRRRDEPADGASRSRRSASASRATRPTTKRAYARAGRASDFGTDHTEFRVSRRRSI